MFSLNMLNEVNNVRNQFPSIILFVVGIIMILERFTTISVFSTIGGEVRSWGIVIAAFALWLSVANLISVHVRKIKAKQNALYSIVMLGAIVFTVVVGAIYSMESNIYKFWYNSFLAPMSQAIYALLAFYLTSAALRSFIARNVEATILLVSAVLVMIGNVPVGENLVSNYDAISSWILNVPNLAGQRGIMICSAIGAVVVGLRVLVGIDKGHFGGI